MRKTPEHFLVLKIQPFFGKPQRKRPTFSDLRSARPPKSRSQSLSPAFADLQMFYSKNLPLCLNIFLFRQMKNFVLHEHWLTKMNLYTRARRGLMTLSKTRRSLFAETCQLSPPKIPRL